MRPQHMTKPDNSEFLSRIVAAKRTELAVCAARVPQATLEKRLRPRTAGVFRDALLSPDGSGECAIIAEVKKASPSRGLLCQKFDASSIAAGYRNAGARALSVLTDH